MVLAAEPQPDAQVTDLFPNLGESSYEDWDYQQSNVLLSFMHQRILAAPDETRHIWKLDGPLEDTPPDCTWHSIRSGTTSKGLLARPCPPSIEKSRLLPLSTILPQP